MPNDARIEELSQDAAARIKCASTTSEWLIVIEEALRTAIREAREPKWVKVEDDTPKEGEWIAAEWTGGRISVYEFRAPLSSVVTRWYPLPDPTTPE